MKTVLVFSIIAFLFSLLLGAIIRLVKIRKIDREDMEDGLDQEVPQVVEYNKFKAYIPPEDMVIWNDLSRRQKREVMKKQEKMVKEGKWIPVTDPETGEEKLITRKEAIEKEVIQ